MIQNQKLQMVAIFPKKHKTKLKFATRVLILMQNQTKQGPELEIGTENHHEPESEVTKGGDTSTNKPGDSIGTEVISPGEGASDDNSDGPTVLQSNPPLGRHYYINNIWNQNKMILP
jgi:hypothetical protein